ncbi:hypothetical protein PYCCODRAFT_1435613 [Trametes coccinea BRFM310]|uniref:FHA domain-containing protein n=1 Tax=Trametes coccinea (strain BRFM310) TaxID=1353009 RepID=A0A1Y2IMD5_TRAC3|nr:hypothetical protein PYCCODRAFT_1435613 [Trametes coccinea BRFM310]
MSDPSAQVESSIQGIVLHVEAYGDEPAESLCYSKAASRTISVGRKSSSGRVLPEDAGRALFRCPVVSRKHAKITFTEHGQVYLSDLHSHHGTYIIRQGQLTSIVVKPEVPTALLDGDVITFGKSVGRDVSLVPPIVARVQLIVGRDDSNRAYLPLPASVVNSDPPNPEKLTKSTSGRYGVFPPSPAYSPAPSDRDSDIQEISRPNSPPVPNPSVEDAPPSSNSVSFQSVRLRLLQSILPPIHQWAPDEYPDEDRDDSFFEGGQIDSPPEFEEEDMDLSSSRASSPVQRSDVDVITASIHDEPAIIGAWPSTPADASESPDDSVEPEHIRTHQPSSSLPSGLIPPEVIEISDDDYGTPFVPPRPDSVLDVVIEEIEGFNQESAGVELPDFVVMKDNFLAQVESIGEASARMQELTDCTEVRDVRANIPEQTADIINEIHAIRQTHAEDEAAFAAHVEHTKDRLNTLDGQMLDTWGRLSARDDQLDNIQTRLNDLGSLVTDLQERSALADYEAMRVEELFDEVNAAKAMLRETCDLQREARTQMLAELEAVKALRAEAAAAVADAKVAVSAVATAASATASLKRKRDDIDDDSAPSAAEIPERQVIMQQPLKRRRIARVVGTVVHTAAVAGVGAVAAWAALAYS